MSKKKKTIAQIKKEIKNLKERNLFLKARALGKFNGQAIANGRGTKRSKDKKNHWSKDWD